MAEAGPCTLAAGSAGRARLNERAGDFLKDQVLANQVIDERVAEAEMRVDPELTQ